MYVVVGLVCCGWVIVCCACILCMLVGDALL